MKKLVLLLLFASGCGFIPGQGGFADYTSNDWNAYYSNQQNLWQNYDRNQILRQTDIDQTTNDYLNSHRIGD